MLTLEERIDNIRRDRGRPAKRKRDEDESVPQSAPPEALLGETSNTTASTHDTDINVNTNTITQTTTPTTDSTISLITTNNLPPPPATEHNVRYAPKRTERRKIPAGTITRTPIDLKPPPTTSSTATPDWYPSIKKHIPGKKSNIPRGDLQQLSYIKDLISKCLPQNPNPNQNTNPSLENAISNLRSYLQQIQYFPFITLDLLKQSKLLSPTGLPLIFSNPSTFPHDIRSDAKALYSRWWAGDIEGSLFRGIKPMRNTKEGGASRISHTLEPGYKFKKSANVVGHNGLENGAWWPRRLCLIRDGAHGELEGGISGKTGEGAFAIVLAAGGYADRDEGDVIEYCGTESPTSKPTKNTNLMLESYAMKQPVRVLRAVNKKSKYAPRNGIRYDGLYEITNQEILNEGTAMYRFTLQRMEGQDPIRWQGVEARPTDLDLVKLGEYEGQLS